MHRFPDRERKGGELTCSFLPKDMTMEVMLPVEPASRQHEREERRRCDRLNMYLAERTPQSIFVVKRQGWIFNYDDARETAEKLDLWMKAVNMNGSLGVDRSTFSQLFVDLDLYDKVRLPYVWAHQVYDAFAKPMRLVPTDPDYGDDGQDGRVRAAPCVSRLDFMAVLDRLLRSRFETPRESFMSRLRAASAFLEKEWKVKEAEDRQSRIAIGALRKKQAVDSPLQSSNSFSVLGVAKMLKRGDSKGSKSKVFTSAMKDFGDVPVKPHPVWKTDRYVSGLLKEPEVIQVVEQYRGLFSILFDSYASEQKGTKQHMKDTDLVALCYDFRLVPSLMSRHEVLRVYSIAVCTDSLGPDKDPALDQSCGSSVLSDATASGPRRTPSLASTRGSQSSVAPPSRSRTATSNLSRSASGISRLAHAFSGRKLAGPETGALRPPKAKPKRKNSGKTTIETQNHEAVMPGEDGDAECLNQGKEVFGEAAFAESICRLFMGYLLVYGNNLHQLLSPRARVAWLLNYLFGVLEFDRSASLDPQRIPRDTWRGPRWTKLLESLEDFSAPDLPSLQSLITDEELDLVSGSEAGSRSWQGPPASFRGLQTMRTSAQADRGRPATPETDEEEGHHGGSDASSALILPRPALPPFRRDAEDSQSWLLVRLLRCTVDLNFNYKKHSKRSTHGKKSRTGGGKG